MKAVQTTALVVALGLMAGGCTTLETQAVAREELKNAQGHVVGFKELMRDANTGEELAQIALFVPRRGERGEIIGYEERVRGGSILRDLNGKRIGGGWHDLRSGKTLVIVVRGRQSDRPAIAEAPSIDELIHLARLGN